MPVVSGSVRIDDWQGETGQVDVYIRLIDASRADARAPRLAELTFRGVDLAELSQNGLDFSVTLGSLDTRIRCEVMVLVDLDGDGQISLGDYVNMIAFPVLTRGYPDRVQVRVHRVR